MIPNSQNSLEKEEKAGGISCPDFKVYYKAKVIKSVVQKQKNRTMQQNRARNKPMHS